jgi:hypothetical protein
MDQWMKVRSVAAFQDYVHKFFSEWCTRITVGPFLTNSSCICCSFSSLGLLQTFETSKSLHVNFIKMSSILV